MAKVLCIETAQGPAWVVDDALTEKTLACIDTFRLSLSLDSKRPTIDRRFFSDDPTTSKILVPELDSQRPIASLLEETLLQSIRKKSHVLRYQRFLEYSKAGSGLDPHTDGHKICCDTNCASTHTLLVYLTDCNQGGETVLLKQRSEKTEEEKNTIHATQPRRGRILLFPHPTPHAGKQVVDVPKICLRAEVCIMDGEPL
jgi:hypothetical protein